MKPFAILAMLAVTAISNRTSAAETSDLVQATTRQRIHPILIRRDFNPLLQVRVDAKQKAVFLSSITFSFEGTDNLADVESLQVFLTGENERFSTDVQFGNRSAAAGKVTFRGNTRLNPGVNTFWLSCRLSASASLDHKVDAQCTDIETSVGTVVATDETPGVRKRIGIALRKHFDDGIHTYRIPVLATTTKGTLLCAYDMRRRKGRDLQEDIDIGLLRSTDGGQSWEPQQVIMDMHEYGGLPQEQNGCSDPGIVVDPKTGKVFVAAVWTWGRPGTHQWGKGGSEPGFEIGQTGQFLMVGSQDDGRTWSEPENLTRKLKKEEWILFVPSPQQGIALPDGTLIMPSQGRSEQDIEFSNLIISRDHGATWTFSNPASVDTSESQAVLLSDGSIMLNCRTETPDKFRTVVVTRDLGQSWQPHKTNRNTLIEPRCNGSTYRFDYTEDGEQRSILVFANPHSQDGRHHQTIQISFDDGQTWPEQHHLLLDVGRGAGYPSLSRAGPRHVGIVYEGSQAHIIFERIPLEELLDPASR